VHVDLAADLALDRALERGLIEPAAAHGRAAADDLAHPLGERPGEPFLRRCGEPELLAAEPHRVGDAAAHRLALDALVPAVRHLPVCREPHRVLGEPMIEERHA
jgi:hypothetical protein